MGFLQARIIVWPVVIAFLCNTKVERMRQVQRSAIATFEPWPSDVSDLVETEKVMMEEAYESLLID